jgi:predicted DNA-binding protein
MNDISLTIRLPHQLNNELITTAKKMGLTRTNLIRTAIHEFLTADDFVFNIPFEYEDRKARMVLNVNPLTYGILESACHKYDQSMNSIVIAISIRAVEQYTIWLQSIMR